MHEHASINRAYRAVFNEALGAVVAVPETARARGTRGTRACADSAFALRRLALAVAFALAGPPAWALDPATLPQGGQVAAGRASIASQGATMTVDQASTRAIVNWQSFDIGSGAAVRFVQPSAAAVTLNRVQSGPASQIFGRMDATGQVYVVNPAGILFGRTAQVNVGGLTASTLQIADEDFLAGRDRFTFAGREGSVVNEGAIRVAPGGRIVLLGARVENRGELVAPGGDVALASGRQVTLAIGAKGHLQVAVDEAQVAALAANGGLVAADGGQVILTAKGADALASSVVSNTGTLQARTVDGQAGRILLLADMAHGTVQAGGTLDASAPQGGDGGFVETSASRVQVAPDLEVTTAAAQGRTGKWLIDPQDYTIAAAGGDITGTQLSSLLGTTDIEIQSGAGASAGNGDIHVNDAVSWNANTLTLTAARDININAVMTADGTSALVMNTGTANGGDAGTGGGAVNVGMNDSGFIGRVDFPGRSGTGFLTINGDSFFVIDALGVRGSTTGADLQGINGNLSGHYALGRDLDASATAGGPWLSGGGHTGLDPIGTSTAGFEFKGSFNGLGHVITNLYTARTSESHVDGGMTITTVYGGLFGYAAASGNISNVGLAGGSTGIVDGCAFAPCIGGSLVAVNHGSVSNTWSTRAVIAGGDAGGLVGRNHGSVRNSFAQGDVQSEGGFDAAGGLVGMNAGAIVDSRAGGTAKGYGDTGGLAGRNFGSITGSHATTTITTLGTGLSNQRLGGLVGLNSGSITDSDAAATVNGNPGVSQLLGGLVGSNDGTIASSHAASTVSGEGGTGPLGGLVGSNMGDITDSHAAGWVDTGAGSTSAAGGLVGRNEGAIVNSHYDVDSLLLNGSHQVTYGGLYGPQYQDWLGHGKALAIGDYAATLPYNGATGYHEIASVQGLKDLLGFSELPGLKFRLTANLDLVAAPGLYIPAFAAAEFDGAGHVLSNLAVAPPTSQVGLFGSLGSGSTLRNITLQNASVGGLGDLGALVGASRGTVMNGHASGAVTGGGDFAVFLGGLVGSTTGSASIQDSDAAVAVSGAAGAFAVGGLVGQNNGSIVRSHATGPVTGGADSAGIGGLAGASGGAITGSYATGVVTADGGSLVGGLVGWNGGAITNSYATGAVSGSSTPSGSSFGVGGLVGYHGGGSIANSYATGDVTGVDTVGGLVGQSDAAISNTYAAGKVEGSSALGGLVGGASSFGSIASSYWNVDTAGPSVTADGMERTTAQVQSLSTYAGWDMASTGGTTSVWRIYEGHTAPLLRSFLIPLSVTPAYDGSSAPLANAADYTAPGGTDTSKIFGTASQLTLSSSGAAGNYLAGLDFSGLYSSQSGYDILATPRTIATPGSAAGDVRLDNPLTWTSGTVDITAANNVDLNGQALASTGGALAFNAGNQIVNAGSVAVNLFDLQGGTWNQVAATLPSLSATDFRISGGTFLRASGGDGSAATPYQLTDIHGVQGMGSAGMLDKNYVLANDVDATGTAAWNTGAGFAPVGEPAGPFSGSLDGRGHVITALAIERPGESNVGLIGTSMGTLSNIGLVGGIVHGFRYVGGLAGGNGGTISNAYNTGTVKATGALGLFVGGLVGSSGGVITGSYATGSVEAADATYVGGLAGAGGTISDSHATGDVLGGRSVGGLVGLAAGAISNSHATGSVTARQIVGGLAGENEGPISGSHATGNVTATGGGPSSLFVCTAVDRHLCAGGLVGHSYGTISDSYATGDVNAVWSDIGGLVGHASPYPGNAGIINSYATGAVSGDVYVGGLVGFSEVGIRDSHHATGLVRGAFAVGGLVGFAMGDISDSYASGEVASSFFTGGGLVGALSGGTISRSFADAKVTGINQVGGLVGEGTFGSIVDSYASGEVNGLTQVGGLVGMQLLASVTRSYANGPVAGSGGGLVGGTTGSSPGPVTDSYWDTSATGQATSAGGTGVDTATMRQLATFAGWDISANGGTGNTWRIYQGNTAPLLRGFLAPLSVTPAYDGTATPLANAADYTTPGGTDTSKIFGTASQLTLSSSGAAGNYLAGLDFSGLYSSQSGYDILATPRTIATPGSAAGDVRLDNPLTWTSGTVDITAANNVDLNGQALASTGGALAFNAGNQIVNAGSVAVNLFDLQGGTWNQVAATLPSLSATDFRISGGTFLRAVGGDGSIATPYQLADIYGVQGVASAGMGDKASVLVGDIDAAGTATWNATAGFAPIALGVSGAFDGQGHTVSGLVIRRPDADDVGLFSDNQGTVADFGLVGGQVAGRDHVGAIAASSSGVIRNVYSTATVGGAYRVGGLVGSNAGQVVDSAAMGSVNGSDATTGGLVAFNQGTITGSHATGAVTGTDYVGGLVGAATAGSITDSHATGTVTGNGQVGGLVGSNNAAIARSHATGAVTALSLSSAGGLVGENLGAIEESYATGKVVAEQYAAGGLVGWDLGGSITRSYATGAVEAKLDAAGGLVGNFGGTISNSYATGEVHGEGSVGGLVGLAGVGGSVTNSYASGAVVGSHDVGGLVGFRNPAAVVAGSYWDVTTTGQATSAGGSGVNTATMRQLATFAGWDISADGAATANVWHISEGYTAPLLRSFLTPITVTANDATKTYDGQAYDGAAGVRYSVAPDMTRLLGTPTYTSGIDAGTHAITLDGLYSNQQGYRIAFTEGTLTVDRKALTVTGMTAANKVYDGTVTAQLSGGALSGLVAGETLGFSGQSGVFADGKNVGIGKAVTVSGITLADGTGRANNYTVSDPVGLTADITPRPLNVAAVAPTKTYDATRNASVGFNDDRIGGDALTFAGGGLFDDKNAGAGKTVTISGFSVGGSDAGNYTVVAAPTTTTGTILRRDLTADVIAAPKVYDGTTDGVALVRGDTRLAGDNLTVSYGAATFADRNAGVGKAVSISGVALSGLDAGNYNLLNPTINSQATIDPRLLTVNVDAADKVYDGTAQATVTLSDNRVAGDLLAVGSDPAFFQDRHAAPDKTVYVSGLGITGADAANYVLASGGATGTADITPRPLSVTALGLSKVYDRTDLATVTFGSDVLPIDSIGIAGTARFDDRNAGTGKTVHVTGISVSGVNAGNYTLANPTTTATADITPRPLFVDALGDTRTYDGTTAATVHFQDDRLPGDVFAVSSAPVAFADRNAGTGKALNLTGIAIAGMDAGNYAVSNTTAATTADILRRSLLVFATGIDKVYDGATAASVTFTDTRVAADQLLVTGDARFADKNVGAGKPVSVTGITLGGADAGNYTLASVPVNTVAAITPRALTIGATGVDKVYDRTTSATVNFTDDRLAGDSLSITGSANFGDRNVGTAKTVGVTGIALSGADAANYSFDTNTATTAAITPRPLLVTASGRDKVYDGTTGAAVAAYGDDRVAGDVLAFSGTASFDDKNVGAGKAVTVTGIAMTGADAGNYTHNTSATASASITPRSLTVTATGQSRVYDRSTAATAIFGDDRVAGDVLAFSGTARFDDKNVGTGKTIGITGIGVTGADAGNYTFNATANATADILPKTLVGAITASDKVYDGTTSASTSGTLSGVVGADTVILASTGQFADRNAGSGKTVGVTARLTGADAGNYLLSANATATASITRAPLLVAVDDLLRLADGLAFFGGGGVHLVGLAAGDDASVLTGTPAWGGTAQGATLPGRYTLSVANYSAVNYDLRYADGLLTIVPRQDLRASGDILRQAQQDVQAPPVPVQPATVAARRGVPLTIAPNFLRVD